jgi:hypothetical protein
VRVTEYDFRFGVEVVLIHSLGYAAVPAVQNPAGGAHLTARKMCGNRKVTITHFNRFATERTLKRNFTGKYF